MWGNAFLVSPVVTAGDTCKDVRFPRGIWYNYWTDERVEGGRRLTVMAGLDRIPLFVRAGSIIPMAPLMRYSDERPLDSLIVEIYPSDSIASSATLYEDDGATLGYQRGECARTLIACTSPRTHGGAPGSVTIGALTGDFQGRVGERTYILEIHDVRREPDRVRCNEGILRAFSPFTASLQKEDGFWYERNDHRLQVRLHCDTGKLYRIDIE
jgi:alpha-glucosidase (family GH31 glycosyl hydrolase)